MDNDFQKVCEEVSEEKKKMSPIVDFYLELGPDGSDRYLREIVNKNLDWYEACHDWVQWAFPLRDPSNFNPEAPLLTNEDIEFLKTNQTANWNFNVMVGRFLYFLGIKNNHEYSGYGFERADNFEQQKYTWFEFNHNALRITRFLSCLSILGQSDFAMALLDWMLVELDQAGIQKSENCLSYWTNALKCR